MFILQRKGNNDGLRSKSLNWDMRKSNFELLRIFAMVFIVGHHLALHGVQHVLCNSEAIQIYSNGNLINKICVAFLKMGGQIGVALFFMLSGYFNIQSKNSINTIKKIVSQCVFYGWFSLVLFLVAKCIGAGYSLDNLVAGKYLLKVLFIPSTSGAWWFITAYLFLILISPILNQYILKFTKKLYLCVLFIFWVFGYIFASMLTAEYYNIEKAIFFYIIGAYLRLFGNDNKKWCKYRIGLIIIFFGIATAVFYQIDSDVIKVNQYFLSALGDRILYYFYVAIIVPLVSVLIFKKFESIEIGSVKYINMISRTALGVYLIHDSLIGRNIIWHEILKIDTILYQSKMFPIYVIFVVLGVLIICSMIDFIRIILFERIIIKKTDEFINKLKQLCDL